MVRSAIARRRCRLFTGTVALRAILYSRCWPWLDRGSSGDGATNMGQAAAKMSLLSLVAVGTGFLVWAGTNDNLARWRAERTAGAFSAAVWRQDSTRIASLTQSGSARNVLCAARGPLAKHRSGTHESPRIVRRTRFHNTLDFTVQPPGATEVFQFSILLRNPGRVTGYTMPRFGDSATALRFWDCVGVQR